MKFIISKNYSLLFIIILLGVSNASTYMIVKNIKDKKRVNVIAQNNQVQTSSSCSYKVRRLGGYQFIRPLLFVDNDCQSEKLLGIKSSLNNLFESYKLKGILNSASFYMKDYKSNDWTAINENEKYSPGSLLKVPELITFLRMNEAKPGVLNKKILFSQAFTTDKKPIYTSKSIQVGKSYTIKELLKYMIEYSDNNATILLNRNIDVNVFQKVFTDLGLTAPDWHANSYPISAIEFSSFMRSLFNASYLTIDDSEYAIGLLTNSDFKDGVVNGVPSNTKMAHKFGESGDAREKQLHESAIFYLNNNPILVTFMTKGKDLNKLPEVIKEASNIVYNQMQNN